MERPSAQGVPAVRRAGVHRWGRAALCTGGCVARVAPVGVGRGLHRWVWGADCTDYARVYGAANIGARSHHHSVGANVGFAKISGAGYEYVGAVYGLRLKGGFFLETGLALTTVPGALPQLMI